MNSLVYGMSNEWTKILQSQFFRASKFAKAGRFDDISFIVDDTRLRMLYTLQKHYKRIATIFSRKAFGILSSEKFIHPLETKSPKEDFWKEINRWMSTQAGAKISKVSKTTKKILANVIHKGQQGQLSHVDIAKNIRKTGFISNPHRARTIALTETHTAAVKSMDVAVKSTRIEMEREWVSARDTRTRRPDKYNIFNHYGAFPLGADGERVAQGQDFIGTGQAMGFPGDPKGDAGNVINCRCVLLYHTIKLMDKEKIKPYEPEEGFLPARNVEELNDKTYTMGLGSFNFDKKYSKPKSLELGNKVAGHFHDIIEKFPLLKKNIAENQKLFNFDFIKGSTIPQAGQRFSGLQGQYFKDNFRIKVAGSLRTAHSLKVGKGTWDVGKDLFSVSRHEYGHHLRQYMASEDRIAWGKLWKSKGLKPDGKIDNELSKKWFSKNVSKYSRTNSSEAFSESFAAYTSPKYKTGMLPKDIEDYFKDLLGAGKLPKVKPVIEAINPAEWKPIKSLIEGKKQIKEKFRIGQIIFKGYNQKESIGNINKIGQHLADTIKRNPGLQEVIEKSRKINKLTIYKSESIPGAVDSTGQYLNGYIELAGNRFGKDFLNSEFMGKTYIRSFSASSDPLGTLLHEIGHHYNYSGKLISKKAWKTFFNKKGNDWFRKNITRYAGTNEREAFAECFSIAVSSNYGSKINILPKEIENYFKKLLKGK